mgnify:CR=1 FL=1
MVWTWTDQESTANRVIYNVRSDIFAQFLRLPSSFFDANSTFTLYPAGSYVGINAIQEYVKFASPESPFVESMTALPGGAGYLKGVNDAGECVFTVMASRCTTARIRTTAQRKPFGGSCGMRSRSAPSTA